MASGAEERKYAPTSNKRWEARRRGQVATSRDFSGALGFLAATAALVGTGAALRARLMIAIEQGLSGMSRGSSHDLSAADLLSMLTSGGILVALCVGPIACAAAATGVLGTLVQTQFNISFNKLHLHWGALSPANGLKRLAPSRAGIDLLKTMSTGAVLAYLAWRLSRALFDESAKMLLSDPMVVVLHGWEQGLRLLWQTGFTLLAIGAADHALQRWRTTKSLRMTLQEVKDEFKMTETKPEVKARVARVRREMFKKRMMKAVPTATVVITNPTHFAVALEYNREKSAAPVVVAKGADRVAAKIREIARSHSVPIIENPPLARALFKECEIGDAIPGPLFNAVAEILAYLIRIKQLVL